MATTHAEGAHGPCVPQQVMGPALPYGLTLSPLDWTRAVHAKTASSWWGVTTVLQAYVDHVLVSTSDGQAATTATTVDANLSSRTGATDILPPQSRFDPGRAGPLGGRHATSREDDGVTRASTNQDGW